MQDVIGCGATIAAPTSSCQGGFRGALIGLFLFGGVAAYRDLALLLAVALDHMVLASQYRSLLHPFIIREPAGPRLLPFSAGSGPGGGGPGTGSPPARSRLPPARTPQLAGQ